MTSLNSGDDYNGWEALHETRDEGWLYIDGVEYDHAVRVERAGVAGGRRAVRTRPRIRNSWARRCGGHWEWTQSQIERDGLTAILRVERCRRFSKAIKRLILCRSMKELRDGQFYPISAGSVTLTHYLGDADHLGLAIFRGPDAHLYSYDGEVLRLVAGETTDGGFSA